MSYITTYQKKPFDPLNAAAGEIDIIDIAHALSLLCRANGHFPRFYSVAQHCLACAEEAAVRGYSKRVQLGCLLHDASEAYLSDVTRPIKALLPEYRRIEEKLQDQIYEKWIASPMRAQEREQIAAVDDALLYYEFLHMMDERVFEEAPPLDSTPDFSTKPFAAVEKEFLRVFAVLTSELG